MKLSVGYLTFPTKKEAKDLVMGLLEGGLIACANIFPAGESYYVWDEAIQKENEVVVILKTRAKNEDKIIKFIKKYHSYECPCITFWPVAYGNSDYLKWVDRSC